MRRKWCRRGKIGKRSETFLLPTDLPDVQLFTVIWHPPKVQEAVRYHYPAARIRRPGDIGHRPLRRLWIIVQVHGSEKRFPGNDRFKYYTAFAFLARQRSPRMTNHVR